MPINNRFDEVLRRSSERGQANHGWLRSFHSFSFADYYDHEHMGFGSLRVINEDSVQAQHGFGMHSHRDMEIVTLVLSGQLHHEDSMGHSSTIGAYEIQRITAGSGMRHSEFNDGETETHLLQIWIEPNVRGIAPSYEQKKLDFGSLRGRLHLIVAPVGGDGAVTIHQDAKIYLGSLHGDERIVYQVAASRKVYVHVIKGRLHVNDKSLEGGDAIMTSSSQIVFERGTEAELLLFDL